MFSRSNVNSRHLTMFAKPPQVSNLTYFDFETEKWRPVEVLDRLPYRLLTYRYIDVVYKHDEEEMVIVTCDDSYRLSTDEVKPLVEVMKSEREWRENLCRIGSVCKYIHITSQMSVSKHSSNISDINGDIIPDILVCDIEGVGQRYIYKDSTRLCMISS